MRKKILQLLMGLLGTVAVAGCTAMDDLPGTMPVTPDKRVKKLPEHQTESPRNQLALVNLSMNQLFNK